MPEYSYTAKDRQGKVNSGQRSALSSEDLAGQLIAEGFIPIDIHISAGKVASTSGSPKRSKWFQKKVTEDELHLLCRQMYSLLHAGIPISIAVTRLGETTQNPTLKDALEQIVISLNKGSALHVALGQYPDIFSEFFVNLVVVGENTGNLDVIFLNLAEYLEMEVDTRKKIKSALRYPIMVVVAILVALVVINFFVLPAFSKLFATLHGQLPWPTQVLLVTSNFLTTYWYYILAISIGLIYGIRSYVRSPSGAMVWGRLQLKIPVVGWLIHRIMLARFAHLMALVLRAGITAVEGIQMVGASTGNVYVGEKIKEVTNLIIRGNTISAAIDKTQLFPPLVTQMIVLGEESGTIDDLLDEVGEFYQREINYDIVRLSDSIEPILIVIIGGMVLILALGIFLPMWNLASLIGKK